MTSQQPSLGAGLTGTATLTVSGLLRRPATLLRHSAVRFLALSGVGLTFDVTLLWLLERLTPLPLQVSVTLAFAATYALNFLLNRRFAFAGHERHVGPQLARYLPQVSLDYVLVLFGVTALVWLGLPLVPARIVAASTNAVVNYSLYRWWTFRGTSETTADRGGTRDRTIPG